MPVLGEERQASKQGKFVIQVQVVKRNEYFTVEVEFLLTKQR